MHHVYKCKEITNSVAAFFKNILLTKLSQNIAETANILKLQFLPKF